MFIWLKFILAAYMQVMQQSCYQRIQCTYHVIAIIKNFYKLYKANIVMECSRFLEFFEKVWDSGGTW